MKTVLDIGSSEIIPGWDTLGDILRSRATLEPKATAYTFLADGETVELALTYAELDEQARAVGAALGRNAQGKRVLLVYPPGLEFIAALFGCFYAGAIAVPMCPPHPSRSPEPLNAIFADAQAAVALTTFSLWNKLGRMRAEYPSAQSTKWIATDSLEVHQQWQPASAESAALALLQYTSGSTAVPKGVMLSHAGILHTQHLIQRAFGQSGQSRIVSWLPHHHDMGLIGAILQPMFLGARCMLMPPTAFLQRPVRWLRAISRFRATTSGGPNFAYDLCVRRTSNEERAMLDLRSWEVAFNGAETVRAESLDSFAEAFAPSGFRRESLTACYGLAEATLLVTAGSLRQPPRIQHVSARSLELEQVELVPEQATGGRLRGEVRPLVSCGKLNSDREVIIVNPELRTRCSETEIGEIWVRGANVALGYWQRPEETMETFQGHLAGACEDEYLRTGDLGFIADCELYIVGRSKDLIVIRGRNHYPQDIELTAERSSLGLIAGGSAAFGIDEGGAERLVLVQEVNRNVSEAAFASVIERIRANVAQEHEVEVAGVLLVRVGAVPRTTSGKVQRQKCRRQFEDETVPGVLCKWRLTESLSYESFGFEDEALGETEPETAANAKTIERWLQREVARRLGTKPDQIGLDEPLTRYGVDSLMALEVGQGLERKVGVVLPPAIWLTSPGIAQLAEEAYKMLRVIQAGAPANDDGTKLPLEELPLSYGQLALWYAQQTSPESAAYNLSGAVRILSDLEPTAFRHAVQALVDRHPALRMTFSLQQGTPVQRIVMPGDLDFQEIDASAWTEAMLNTKLIEEGNRPFDLEQGPLLRIRLWQRPAGRYVLLLTMHHIITDFWSLAVMIRDLAVLYATQKGDDCARLTSLSSQYGEHVRWQKQLLDGSDGERLKQYWLEELGGELPLLNLATDRPRPPIRTYLGASQTFHLDNEIAGRLKALGQEHNATLYVVLLAAFSALLHRYTGQHDILLGSPTAGRNYAGWADLVGYFINPVVIRARVAPDSAFVALLAEVRRRTLSALEHKDYPFSLLVEQLHFPRDPSRSPLIQAMFVMQKAQQGANQGLTSLALNEAGTRIDLDQITLETLSLKMQPAQYDITLMVAEMGAELRGSLKYNTDLFDASTIERLTGQFCTLLKGIACSPEQQILQLPLLEPGEQRQVVLEWNKTQQEFPREKSIGRALEEQVELAPDAIALEDEDAQLTYALLNSRANQLAHYLQCLGVGPESRVGILMERSVDLLVAMIGILKAGGAYVPLDPGFPPDRSAYVLRDRQAKVLLTQRRLCESLPRMHPLPIYLDTEWDVICQHSDRNPESRVSSQSLAYVIHTSGSAGRPKGVMVRQLSLMNLATALDRTIYVCSTSAKLRIGLNSPLVFDASVKQLVMLMSGHSIHIVPEEVRSDGRALISYFERNRLDALDCTPSHLELLMRSGLLERMDETTMLFLIGGEQIGDGLWEMLSEASSTVFFNVYGPTECTVDATACRVSPALPRPVIGRALANVQTFLLDIALQPVPIGVPGEIHIAGAGLARGYVNLPDLTAEKFVPNPFNNEHGGLLYRTGDLGRYMPDGNVEYLGRIDRQVKIRGFRMELGEIEAALRGHELVREAVVVAQQREIGGKRLVAYIVPVGEEALPIDELQRSLCERLPAFMVPSAFVAIDVMPLTPNGKIDYRALPTPDRFQSPLEAGYVAPRTLVEELLARTWSQALGVEQVGVFDNFFELGGHSLLATQLISQLQDVFPGDVPLLSLFFEQPTVAGLAETIVQTQDNEEDAVMILLELQSIAQLSDEEINQLLTR